MCLCPASICSFLTVLSWYPNTSLRTWCLVLRSLTLMTNMPASGQSVSAPLTNCLSGRSQNVSQSSAVCDGAAGVAGGGVGAADCGLQLKIKTPKFSISEKFTFEGLLSRADEGQPLRRSSSLAGNPDESHILEEPQAARRPRSGIL